MSEDRESPLSADQTADQRQWTNGWQVLLNGFTIIVGVSNWDPAKLFVDKAPGSPLLATAQLYTNIDDTHLCVRSLIHRGISADYSELDCRAGTRSWHVLSRSVPYLFKSVKRRRLDNVRQIFFSCKPHPDSSLYLQQARPTASHFLSLSTSSPSYCIE